MFYNELGGTGGGPLSISGDPDLALFTNLWAPGVDGWQSSTEYTSGPFGAVWDFTSDGYQYATSKYNWWNVWAVRDGDVGGTTSSVPEPGTLMLMGTGLAGLIATRKRFMRRLG